MTTNEELEGMRETARKAAALAVSLPSDDAAEPLLWATSHAVDALVDEVARLTAECERLVGEAEAAHATAAEAVSIVEEATRQAFEDSLKDSQWAVEQMRGERDEARRDYSRVLAQDGAALREMADECRTAKLERDSLAARVAAMSNNLRAALRKYGVEPCSDGHCVFRFLREPGGMHTNGGCRHLKEDRHEMSRTMLALGMAFRDAGFYEAPAPLTVAAALMLPEVRSGVKWIEYERPNGCGGTLASVVAIDDGVIRRTHSFNRGDQFFDWQVAIRSTDLDATCALVDPEQPR